MSDAHEKLSERDEIEMLLPWYFTGRLDAADRAHVDDWLKREPELARQLELIRAEQDETRLMNERLPAPASLTVERTFNATGTSRRFDVSNLLAGVREFFAAPQPWSVRRAGVAVGCIMLLQAGMIGWLAADRSGGVTYQTASGGTATPANGSFVLVRFADTATAAHVAAALTELRMSVVDGPRDGGFFMVRIGTADLSAADRDARIGALRLRDGVVTFVTRAP